jgi:CDP-paratose 2-epimerase
MNTAIVTGSGGVVGSAMVDYLVAMGMYVVGIDNDTRGSLFGNDASTWPVFRERQFLYKERYCHEYVDVRDHEGLASVFRNLKETALVVHAAGQPSHDWSAEFPLSDFGINALGTLNVLDLTRLHAPNATFIYLSTNKVYGDHVNCLYALEEQETRYDVPKRSPRYHGMDIHCSTDYTMHSPFGVSKLAGDLYVQEYGKYYGLKTCCLRCGCLTGVTHKGVELHGFLSYLVKCAAKDIPYVIYGYKGKQVRDNLDTRDLARLIWSIYQDSGRGWVFNVGGGRANSCSILEAIQICNDISGKELEIFEIRKEPRKGDHKWWITDIGHVKRRYGWEPVIGLRQMMEEMYDVYR